MSRTDSGILLVETTNAVGKSVYRVMHVDGFVIIGTGSLPVHIDEFLTYPSFDDYKEALYHAHEMNDKLCTEYGVKVQVCCQVVT